MLAVTIYPDQRSDLEIKLQSYNKINSIIKRNFSKHMLSEIKNT
jgi:hypothetical protein